LAAAFGGLTTQLVKALSPALSPIPSLLRPFAIALILLTPAVLALSVPF
jgi:hypothetical protein